MSQDDRKTGSARAEVIYDGQCEFCIAQARRLAGGDDRIALRSFHDDGVLDDYPDLTFDACMEEMKLVVDGKTYGGAEAVVRAFALRHAVIGRLLFVYYTPGIRALADAAYRWVANNRYRIAGKRECDTGECRRHA